VTDRLPWPQTDDVKRASPVPSTPQPNAEPAVTPAVSAGLQVNFRALFYGHASYVASSLRRLGVRERDVEDVTHDVFLAVCRHLADYDPARPVKPWLFGFAIRAALAHRRRKQYTHEVIADSIEAVDQAKAPDEEVAARQSRNLVLQALAAIAEDRRPVFVLHDIDAVAMPDIAQALGIPLNTGYSRLRLARAEFAAAVQRIRARSSRHES
jgi:RNA polymerase sigma-70 factor (ECF subfamily)